MRFRLVLFVLGASAIAYGGTSLDAKTDLALACCERSDDCGDIGVCCDLVSLGFPACSPELSGECMVACPRPGGGDLENR